MNEADTCRKFVVPKLQAAGWDNEPHSIAEQRTITDGRIVPIGKGFVRKSPKRADFILRYERNFPLAVVEAKADWQTAGQGIQQAKEYAELLQLKFAYATNGEEILEFDYFTGKETIVQSYPTPAELWARYSAAKKIPTQVGAQMLTPMNHLSGKGERYYQEIAINRAVEGILTGQRRQLLTMATGTGKTAVAFQICWKLWTAMWNRTQSPETGRARHSMRAASEPNDPAEQERRARSDTPYPETDTLSASIPFSASDGEKVAAGRMRCPPEGDGVRCRTAPEHRKPKILFLADRNILVDDPMGKDFTPFGDARWKLEGGVVNKGREMYFAIYQSLAKDERRPGLYKEFPRDFFDLIIVDECHRGSARDDSNWREILNYFEPAYQLGMTATPLREENRDTYLYFGNPIYTYSLRQGIDDGFLAPYRVHRIISEWDAAGWRPSKDDLDRYGRPIPDEEYGTKDFERTVALRARTEAIAKHLTDFLKKHDRFAKTVVFCVDQEHADEMRRALNNLNADLVGSTGNLPVPVGNLPTGTEEHTTQRKTTISPPHATLIPPGKLPGGAGRLPAPPFAGPFSDYVCRVTSNDGDIGRGHLGRFQDVEGRTPVILTTSQMLTTGVDMPTCKNVVLARVVGSMTEFKQIIGRGTRVRDEYGKLWFNILDYTGSATRLFADPTFDGDPVKLTQEEIDEHGNVKETDVIVPEEPESDDDEFNDKPGDIVLVDPPINGERRKFYFDGGQVEIATHLVFELDPDGKQLRCVRYTEFAAEKVRSLCPSTPELRARWADPELRAELIAQLAERGITFEQLAEQAGHPDADPFDLLCHLAFNAPLRTRRERAQRLRSERKDFFEQHGPEARQILDELLEKYAEDGAAQFVLPDVLKVPPMSDHGQIGDITKLFGGADKLRGAVNELQTLLYAA